MPRKHKRYLRSGAPCAVDDAFFARAEKALGKPLNDNARTLIAFAIGFHNACCHANDAAGTRFKRPGAGRASDANVHVFVDGILDILEGEAGIVVRVSKRQRKNDHGHPVHGPVAEFIRIVHDALSLPDRDANALARLVTSCAPWLGETMAGRRQRRANTRKPGDDYIARQRQAWKNTSE